MKPAPFRLEQPETIDALCSALAEHGEDARILAGGQSLVPMMNFRLVSPEVLIDINRVPGLSGIRVDGDRLVIGAMTRHAAVAASDLVAEHAPLIALAYAHIAHVTVRNRGTIGGNLSHGDPSSELPAVAITLGAEFVVTGQTGSRVVSAEEFFEGMFEVDVQPGEFLSEIRVPLARADQSFGFQEFSPRHGDFATVLVAVCVTRSGPDVAEARIVHGAVQERPARAIEAEALLIGGPLTSDIIETAAKATGSVEPTLQNYHGDAAYKSDLLRSLTARALQQAAGRS